MSSHKIIIAIDGYSSCGKSTLARELAKMLGYNYIDSGAMYRAITLYFLRNQVIYSEPEQVLEALTNRHPQPDDLVFISSFAGGEVFRSGCAFRRGQGNIFYFSPGHETYPVYHQAEVRRVIANAVRWAAQGPLPPYRTFGKTVHSPAGWLEG